MCINCGNNIIGCGCNNSSVLPSGPAGVPGTPGTNGTNGTSLITTTATLANNASYNGYTWINPSNWNVYSGQAGVWVLVGNIAVPKPVNNFYVSIAGTSNGLALVATAQNGTAPFQFAWNIITNTGVAGPLSQAIVSGTNAQFLQIAPVGFWTVNLVLYECIITDALGNIAVGTFLNSIPT